MKRGILFDLDGTLVQSFTTTPLPGVAGILDGVRAKGGHIGVATNQAGPLWRAITGQAKYPTEHMIAHTILEISKTLNLTQVLWLISVWDPRAATTGKSEVELDEMVFGIQRNLLDALQGSLAHVMVFADPSFRKPKPGMLWKAATEWMISPADLCYVGDMASDEEAAHNAEVSFVHASAMATLLAGV